MDIEIRTVYDYKFWQTKEPDVSVTKSAVYTMVILSSEYPVTLADEPPNCLPATQVLIFIGLDWNSFTYCRHGTL